MFVRVILTVVFLSLIFWLITGVLRKKRATGGTGYSAPFAGIPGRDLKALRLVCRGDERRVRRLIEYELERSPGITNREACRRAVQSLRRDNA